MDIRSSVIIAAILLSASIDDARGQSNTALGSGERRAIEKARCVHSAIEAAVRKSGARDALPPVKPPATDAQRETYQRAEAEYFRLREAGVRACLTEDEVRQIGRFSVLEDHIDWHKGQCPVLKGAWKQFARVADNYDDGDLVNGAANWMRDYSEHNPFYAGQSEIRNYLKTMPPMREVCARIIREFGPNGTAFPGLVKR